MRYYRNMPYIKRVFALFKPKIIVIFLICLVYGFVEGGNMLLFCLFFIVICFSVLLIYSIQINKIFLISIDFDEEKGTVKYSVIKYDKYYKEVEVNINKVEIKIIEKIGVYRTFQLELRHNNTILRQRTISGWTENHFVDILTTFNKLKERPTFINYVKK